MESPMATLLVERRRVIQALPVDSRDCANLCVTPPRESICSTDLSQVELGIQPEKAMVMHRRRRTP